MISLNSTIMNGILRPTFNLFNIDYKKDVVGIMRGFSKEDSLEKYRFQISG
jgi:hypothetical protein